MNADIPESRVRRPRVTRDRETELLVATLDVLRKVGYEALTMDDVAARARCSKATLYRQWHTKAGMIAAALHAAKPVPADGIDTGSLRGDLLHLVGLLAAHAEKETALLAAVGHAILRDAELAAAVRTALVDQESVHVMSLVDRAVERGELPGRPAAAEFLHQMLAGAVLGRVLFEGRLADSAYLTRLIDNVLMPALRNS